MQLRTVAAPTVLADWEELGLRSLGGSVTYRASVSALPQPGVRFSLDLGTVRGTADVRVNGTLVDRLVWSPWTTEVTDHLHVGDNDIEVVVRNTLGGYLEDASPTAAVAAGQARAGLYGPVTLIAHRSTTGEVP